VVAFDRTPLRAATEPRRSRAPRTDIGFFQTRPDRFAARKPVGSDFYPSAFRSGSSSRSCSSTEVAAKFISQKTWLTPRPRKRARSSATCAIGPVSGGRAIGEPSPALERAAVAERAYVVKDFGRLGKGIAAMLALLVASGLVVNALLR